MWIAYSGVYRKKKKKKPTNKNTKIIKSEWLHYANLLFIIRLLEHFTTECTILQTY